MPVTTRTFVAASTGAVAAVLTVACSAESPAPESGFDPGMGHIHGLVINPADGELYAGTHYGVFTVSDVGAERVGGVVQDFMGLTAAGDDHFLASGHPSPDDFSQPPNLGLIESTDGGETWEALSLSGDADFHALEYKHGLVYGYDSVNQQFMVSADKREWTAGARFPAHDLAVSPTSPDDILATGERGLAHSSDRGRLFEVVNHAPRLVYVDWPIADELVGVDASGTVHVSSDGGTTWATRGNIGASPHALLAVGNGEMYVATGHSIVHSTDGGETFTAVFEH